MVVLIKKRKLLPPTPEETTYDLREYLQHLPDTWPPLADEDVHIEEVDGEEVEQSHEEEQDPQVRIENRGAFRGDLERIAVWTMSGSIGAVITYGIAVGDKEVIMTVLLIATVFMIRLIGRTRKQPQTGGTSHGTRSPTTNQLRQAGSGRAGEEDSDDS